MWIISYLNKNKLLCVDHSLLCIVIAVSLLYNPRVQSLVLQLQIRRIKNYEPKLTQASLVQQAMGIFLGFYFRQSSTFSFDGKHEGFTSFHPPVIGAIGAMNILKEAALCSTLWAHMGFQKCWSETCCWFVDCCNSGFITTNPKHRKCLWKTSGFFLGEGKTCSFWMFWADLGI